MIQICAFGIIGNEGHYKVALVSPAPQTAPQLTPTTPSIAGFSVNKPGAPGFEAYLYFQGYVMSAARLLPTFGD